MPTRSLLTRDARLPQASSCLTATSTSQPNNESLQGGASLKLRNSAALERQRRKRLLNIAVERRGPEAVGLLLEILEAKFGGDLGVDRYLERLIDASPRANSGAFNTQITGPRS